MQPAIRSCLTELRQRLSALYAKRLVGIWVFGSHARASADSESDLDVLIVLDRVGDYTGEIERTSATIAELSLRHGVSISRVFASDLQWRTDETLFFRNVRSEAVPA